MLSRPDLASDIELATGIAALEALRPEWDALWRRSSGATPFHSPAWLIPWWRHIGEGALLTLAIREHGERVGLPLHVHMPQDVRRRLFPLGNGTTDYLDALVAPGREAAVMAAAFRQLAALAGRFDIVKWPQLRPGLPLLAPAPAGWSSRVEADVACPATPLPRCLDDLGAVMSRKTLRDLRTVRKRAAEAGVLDPPTVQAAHRTALPELLRAGVLRLQALHLDGVIVAVHYALTDPPSRSGRRVYLYISGFDPALDRLSPGMLLLGHAVEQAVPEGFATLDFLRGQERYKYSWGARDEPTWRRILQPPAGAGA